jgi:hypothetical protein
VGPWTGVLAMTMVVRDEEDILAANLDHHLAQGVDVILVTDHRSTDRTPEILSEYARTGRVQADRDDAPVHDQVSRVNRLLRIAARSHGADWVIHCDADEFWLAAAGSLRDVFAAVPERFGYMIVERNNYLPVAQDGRHFYERMVFRERRTLNIRGEQLEPKVAQRPRAAASVTPGNHDLENPTMERAPDIGAVAVGHFPMRTFEQFERKVINTGTGYELLEDRDAGVGGDQLELLRIQRSGRLRDYFQNGLLDPERLQKCLDTGEVVADERLRAALCGERGRVDESPWIQELLHRMWFTAARVNDTRMAAERRARELEAAGAELEQELELARQEAAKLADTLALVRASRTMRYTAPARRAYYGLRRRRNDGR